MTSHLPLPSGALVRRCGSSCVVLFPAVMVLGSIVTLFYAAASSKEVVGASVQGGEVMLHTRDGFGRERGIMARPRNKDQKDRPQQAAAEAPGGRN